ncbi:MAG: YraN family protein [Proteobacteria bacterium]|nr:YraN family protein [Pseudomonadota bacterium]
MLTGTIHEKGAKGEEIALNYLLNKGYLLIQKNYRIKGGEIDLIVSDHQTLIMVEVRMRQKMMDAAESIIPLKCRRLTKTAQNFIMQHQEVVSKFPFMRFDVILINKNGEIHHIENAFGAES